MILEFVIDDVQLFIMITKITTFALILFVSLVGTMDPSGTSAHLCSLPHIQKPESPQQPTEIRWYSMREAQLKASTTGKKILVHIYAEWCVWCEKMDNNTYTNDQVKKHLLKYYYPVRVDGESQQTIVYNGQKMTMEEFAKTLGVTAYPTILFIDSEGKLIAQQGGFIKPDIFTKLLSFVGSDAYQKQEFDQFTSNDRP
ncbi:MAG: thioredoxin family protein [Bacteroidota bacterium]